MALFLVVLGGAAVVEVHRAITGGGNKDIKLLREREETLRKQLQVLQEIRKELEQTKSERELTAQEAANLAAINAQLQKDKEELESESCALKAEREELTQRSERLIERQQLLEQCAESLKLENNILMQQFDRLKIKYEQENASFQEQLQVLKQQVSTNMQSFIIGETSAEQLVSSLTEMGVELNCTQEQITQLTQRLATATTEQQRTEELSKVELKVDATWIQQLRLVTSSPTRAARLFMSNASAHEAAAATTTAGPIPEQQRPLAAPRSLESAVEQKGAAVSNKLSSHAVEEEDAVVVDTIPAVHAVPVKETSVATEAKVSTSRSLVFRSMKKVAKIGNKKNAVVELEMPLELRSGASMEGPASNALVPM